MDTNSGKGDVLTTLTTAQKILTFVSQEVPTLTSLELMTVLYWAGDLHSRVVGQQHLVASLAKVHRGGETLQ